MIKVLHSEIQNKMGGIESFLINLSSCFDFKNVRFDFLMRGNNVEARRKLEEIGCNVYDIPNDKTKYISYVLNLLNKEKYDIIHIHKNSCVNPVFPIIGKRKSKIIIHSHNTQPTFSNFFSSSAHFINRPIINYIADKKIACSDLAAKWMFLKSEDVEIIKNGILIDQFLFNEKWRQEIRTKFSFTDQETIIGCIGAFKQQKNQEFLIDIVNILPEQYKVIFVGSGDREDKIKKEIDNAGLNNRFVFCGQRNDVNKIMSAIDILAMPSLYEGFPMVSVEAQASGLPIIASNRITKTIQLTPNVSFCSLDNPQEWIENFRCNRVSDRKKYMKLISDAGYDCRISAARMKTIYEELTLKK